MELFVYPKEIERAKNTILQSVKQHKTLDIATARETSKLGKQKIEVLDISRPSDKPERNMTRHSHQALTKRAPPFTPNDYQSKSLALDETNVECAIASDYSSTPPIHTLSEEDLLQCGEEIALERDKNRLSILNTCSNRFYAGGVSRNTVCKPIDVNLLRQMERSLNRNRAERFCSELSQNNRESKILQLRPPAFLAFVHPDQETDIKGLAGFIPTTQYVHRDPISEIEIGCFDDFIFLTTPVIQPIDSEGANVAHTGLLSTDGKRVDVFQMIVTGKRAWTGASLDDPESIDLKVKETRTAGFSQSKSNDKLVVTYWDGVYIQNHSWLSIVETGIQSRN